MLARLGLIARPKRTAHTIETPQGAQVGRLGAEGQSNREISAQLFLSASTAGTIRATRSASGNQVANANRAARLVNLGAQVRGAVGGWTRHRNLAATKPD